MRLLLLLLMMGISQGRDTSVARHVPAVAVRKSSTTPVVAPQSSRRSDSLYIAVLEKTNQQLSLSSNPLAILISTLGVLFAALAIIAAVLVFRQSADFRKILQGQLDEYRQTHDKQLENYSLLVSQLIEDTKAKAVAAIAETKEQLETAEAGLQNATGPDRQRWEDVIDTLQRRVRALTEGKPQPIAATNIGIRIEAMPVSAGSSAPKTRVCWKCHKTFGEADFPHVVGVELNLIRDIVCPYCGAWTRV